MNYTNNVYFTLIFTYCVYYSVVTFSVSCYIHHGSFMRVLIDILVVEWCWLLLRLLQRNDELWIVGHSRREWTCVVLLIEMLEVHFFFDHSFWIEKTVMDLHQHRKRNVGWSFLFTSIIFISHACVSPWLIPIVCYWWGHCVIVSSHYRRAELISSDLAPNRHIHSSVT